MKIAYGTYAMPNIPLEEAVPMLAEMGYNGVEICIGSKHIGSLPDQIDQARRNRLKNLLIEHNMGVPALFIAGIHILAEDDPTHENYLAQAREAVRLAKDLVPEGRPVLSIGIGGKSESWEQVRHEIVRRFKDYAQLASDEGVILAGEAHCGAAVDRSERALWVFEEVDSPSVGLHFDIVHFYLANEEIEDSVKAMYPITVHTHITDARKHEDGTFDLLLLGQGDLDSVTYLKAMDEAGWTSYITLEVSARVWSKEDYDPVEAAVFSYKTLDNAFKAAGVERT